MVIADSSGISCPLCRNLVELVSHIFCTCELVLLCGMWSSSGWVIRLLFLEIIDFFLFSLYLGGRAKSNGGFVMICHLIVRSIWRSCNDAIIKGVSKSMKEVEDKSFFLAQKWFLDRSEVLHIFWLDSKLYHLPKPIIESVCLDFEVDIGLWFCCSLGRF